MAEIAKTVEELEKRLKEPFPAKDIEWRIQSSGEKDYKPWAKCLAYVTNRAIMERLDDVCGIAGWSNEFKEISDGGFLCGIGIDVGKGNWIYKWDGADKTAIEHTKGGISSAMKRTGAQWGIGRYLYNLDIGWADICKNGKFSAKTKDNKWFKWNPPQLPKWALPEGVKNKPIEKEIKPTSNMNSVPMGDKKISEEQFNYLTKLLTDKKTFAGKDIEDRKLWLCEQFNIERLSDLQARDGNKAIAKINNYGELNDVPI